MDSSESSYTIVEGNCPIDNVRVYPKGAEVVSYTWLPAIGVRSSTDNSGISLWYDYDVAGRLKAVYDQDDNPVTGYYYKYETADEH